MLLASSANHPFLKRMEIGMLTIPFVCTNDRVCSPVGPVDKVLK